jgi:hypothetical protein
MWVVTSILYGQRPPNVRLARQSRIHRSIRTVYIIYIHRTHTTTCPILLLPLSHLFYPDSSGIDDQSLVFLRPPRLPIQSHPSSRASSRQCPPARVIPSTVGSREDQRKDKRRKEGTKDSGRSLEEGSKHPQSAGPAHLPTEAQLAACPPIASSSFPP